MGDGLSTPPPPRGTARTAVWRAACKDCRTERPDAGAGPEPDSGAFEYSSTWAERTVDRGNTRSDRCERHRSEHRELIRALAVPYVDLRVIGQVPDPEHPTGPLGGLGPLPVLHREQAATVDLSRFEFGMTDADILQIAEGLRTKRVAVVEAGTGTGKSTFMPFRLMNPPPGATFRLRANGPIVVTEPRLAAATGVARFVGEELCFGHDSRSCRAHVGAGYPVGYQVRGEKQWDGACDLIYVTDGTMINWLRDGQLTRIGAVIVDEAHERSENIDIILAHLRDSVARHKHLRVIITSATLDREFFVHYFGGPSKVFHHYVPATKSFGYGVPLFVGLEVSDDVVASGTMIAAQSDGRELRFEGWNRWGPADAAGDREDLHATTRALERLRCARESPVDQWKNSMVAAVAEQVVAVAAGTTWGDILAFLPTTEKIGQAVQLIEGALTRRGLQFDVYPLLSTTDRAVSEKAIAARSRGQKRKIVVSSNLAETSLTVKGVRYVVDSGLICQPTWDPKIASGSYPTVRHSQSGLRQRWGRVGRDAPGWVFPLYTPEQFLALPKNTPPGSTQTNLETFYMKLISAGLEVERLALPANFEHDEVVRDEDGLRSMATFTAESARARRALALSGATDSDGHLTEFGRDLERFPGEGSHALAIMLADQLACVHEVALALHVLGGGTLYGHKDGCILQAGKLSRGQAGRDWPVAWRVEAARRHRALALGCMDDLDVLLRVYAEWQRARNRAAWCATWWVNEAALQAGVDAVRATLELLSPAMRAVAWRPTLPELAPRARGVLTRAMMSMQYERVEGSTYRLVGAVDDEPVTLSQNQLVEAPERVLALHRFRPGSARDDASRVAIVSHVVQVAPWAELPPGGSDALGLELLLRANERRADAATADRLQGLRDRLPVGATIALTLGGDVRGARAVVDARVELSPFLRPRDVAASGDASGPPSGFDRDWSLEAPAEVGRPTENDEDDGLDLLLLEANDEPSGSPPQPTTARELAPALPPLNARPLVSSAPLPETMWARVVGYHTRAIDPDGVTLVVDPLIASGAPASAPPSRTPRSSPDPALHDDLEDGALVDVQVCCLVRDHDREYVQLGRRDGRGSFYLDASTPGIAVSTQGPRTVNDATFLRRLSLGTCFEALVVRDSAGAVTASALPWAHADLRRRPIEVLSVGGTDREFFRATVVSAPNQWRKVLVELDAGEDGRGVSPQFEVRVQDLVGAGITPVDAGRRLLVALQPDRGPSRLAIALTPTAASAYGVRPEQISKAAVSTSALAWDGELLRAGKDELPVNVAQGLAALGRTDAWRRAVWAFYADSLYVAIRDVRPRRVSASIEVAPAIASLLRTRKRDIVKSLSADVAVLTATRVEVSADDEAALAGAVAALRAIEALPRVCALLPLNTAGMVVGREHANRIRLESAAEIRYVWIEHDRVSIVGSSARAVQRAVADVSGTVSRATGVLTVPPGKVGRLIGKGGSTIKSLRAASGCSRVDSDQGRSAFTVEGPSVEAVERFFALASQQVPGSTGRIVSKQGLTIIEDTADVGRARTAHRRDASGAEVPAGKGCPLAAMVVLAVPGALIAALWALLTRL